MLEAPRLTWPRLFTARFARFRTMLLAANVDDDAMSRAKAPRCTKLARAASRTERRLGEEEVPRGWISLFSRDFSTPFVLEEEKQDN